MTTSVTGTITTQSLPAAATVSSSLTATTKGSPESTLASIADALMGLTTSTIQKPNGQSRMFARIERMIDSLAKLIEAFATFKSATVPQSTISQQAAIPGEAPPVSAAGQPTTQPPQTTEGAPSSDPAPIIPTIEMTPSVDTDPPVVVSADMPVAPPTPQPSPYDIGSPLGKPGGFLWKPVSDKNGDLVVLLPKKLTGKVQEVRILSPDGTKNLGKGKYSGVGNGDRDHFRFSKPGSGYPDGAIVYIKLENGTTRHVKIGDTSRRIER